MWAESFLDEMEKISNATEIAKNVAGLLKRHWKFPAGAAAALGTYNVGGKALRRYQIGKHIEEQMEARQQ